LTAFMLNISLKQMNGNRYQRQLTYAFIPKEKGNWF